VGEETTLWDPKKMWLVLTFLVKTDGLERKADSGEDIEKRWRQNRIKGEKASLISIEKGRIVRVTRNFKGEKLETID